MTQNQSYKKPLFIAVGLHLLLFAILVLKLPAPHYQYPSKGEKTKIVQATTVTSGQVAKAMRDIQYRQQAAQRQQKRQLAALHTQALAQQRRRDEAAARLSHMKKEQSRLIKAHQQQEAALAHIKRQTALAHKRMLAQQKKREQMRRRLALQKKKALQQKQKRLQQQLLAQQLAGDTQQLHKVQTNQMTGLINKYKALILAAISQNWLVPGGVNDNLLCEFDIHLAPGGTVLSVRLIKSSGNFALDDSARTAIYKASPLPVPHNPTAFNNFRDLRLGVSPKDIVHS